MFTMMLNLQGKFDHSIKFLGLIGMHNRKSDGEDKPLENVTLGVFLII